MSNEINKLQNINNHYELARYLGYKSNMTINEVIFNSSYDSFKIPKKNGFRQINAPDERLSLLQHRLLEKLNLIIEEELYSGYKPLSYGFRSNLSIYDNAKNHKNKRYVFNLDLEDFFSSFNFGRVRGYFIKNKIFKLEPKLATVLANILCFENKLPQGAATSPIMTNFICHILDIKLNRLAINSKCNYSRYADDITFSTNVKTFPKNIAIESNDVWIVGNSLKHIIKKEGFEINQNKIRMQHKKSKQSVTGLTVNKYVNVDRQYIKTIRAICHSQFKKGYSFIDENPCTIEQIEGMLNFIYQIKKKSLFIPSSKKDQKDYSFIKLYKKFLFYKYFVHNVKPVIITEGISDIRYIKAAVATCGEKLDVIYFPRKGDIPVITEIHEGASSFNSVFHTLKNLNKEFKCKNLAPLIMIADKDQIKSKYVLNAIDKFTSVRTIDTNACLIYLGRNDNEDVESLFDTKLLETELNGLKFSKDNNYNKKNNYGKNTFSLMVYKNRNYINFDNFKGLINEIGKYV